MASSPTPADEASLPALLVMLTVVTGTVDAVSYVALGHVFVANMTGNVAFLGFAAGGAQEFSIAATLAAIGAFLAGAAGGGRLASSIGAHRVRLLALATLVNLGLVAAALGASLMLAGTALQLALVVLLALAMGLQNAVARFLGVPDLTTTVLTLTLTGLAAESRLAGGDDRRLGRRLAAIAAMFVGAALGAFAVVRYGLTAGLATTLAMLAISAAGACRAWRQARAG